MKTRNLETLIRHVGDVESVINHRLKTQSQVNVLEIGSGLGVALSQLADRFPQVAFYGVNIKYHQGQIERPNIKYLYGDAGNRVDLEDGTIDFAFSQVSLQQIPNKLGCIKEVFRTLKKEGQFWYYFPQFLQDWSGPSTFTVSDGQRSLDFKDYLVSIDNPNVIVNDFQYGISEGIIKKTRVAIEKRTEVLDLHLEKDYVVEDLGYLDVSKKGYCASHYRVQPTQKLPEKKQKMLIIARNPQEYIVNNPCIGDVASFSYITKDTVFFDNTPNNYSTMFSVDLTREDNRGFKVQKVVLDYITQVKFNQIIIEDGLAMSPNLLPTFKAIRRIKKNQLP